MNGNKNYLPDALTRELAMFSRSEGNDEGRNPRSRRPEPKEKNLWERYKSGDKTVGPLHDRPGYQYIVSYGAAESSQPADRVRTKPDEWDKQSKTSTKGGQSEEELTKKFLLCPMGTASTDRSQGKRPASPSQTADGKGISRPLKAAALPKSRITPNGVLDVHGYQLNTFPESVFYYGKPLAFYQKALLDNLLFSFQENDFRLMIHSLEALAEELHELHQKHKQQSVAPTNVVKVKYLDGPECARVPVLALKESEWFKFHDWIGSHSSHRPLPQTLFAVPGPYPGRYVVNVQSEHPQEHKIWLVENGFVHNLWTKNNDDLKGLPAIIVNTVKNVRKSECILRLKFRSTPPEWVQKKNGEAEYISPYHYVRIIQGRYSEPACTAYNGQPNSSIPWMKAMALEYIRKIIEDDRENTYLASGDKIIVTAYDHPDVVSSDLFLSLKRGEIDSTLRCAQWIEAIEKDKHYKVYEDTDMEDNGQQDADLVLGNNSEDLEDIYDI